ncbi:MAG: co-chaperone GroES [Microthrixaceae bacterium]
MTEPSTTPAAPANTSSTSAPTPSPAESAERNGAGAERSETRLGRHDKLPMKMLQDRLMVQVDTEAGERSSRGGILIPATAQIGKRLTWAEVKAAGPAVRNVEVGDQVLFDPSDLSEVEVGGEMFVILRERDVHAVASDRLDGATTGLYL